MPKFPWEALFTAVWEWEIFDMISASCRIVYDCLQKPGIIHRTNSVCFSTPHQRTEAFLVNPKMPWQNQCQLQGILRTSWTELKSRANENRADELNAKGCEGAAVGEEAGEGAGAERGPGRGLCACVHYSFCPT